MLTDFQRRLAADLFAMLAPDYALAGSGALQMHGIIDRPTDDIDAFRLRYEQLNGDWAKASEALRKLGYTVVTSKSDEFYVHATVSRNGQSSEVDLGVDWREHEPVMIDGIPTLHVEDAVGNKVAAAFSRGEPRDISDYDEIVHDGRWTESELDALATERDAGFDRAVLDQNIAAARARSQRSLTKPVNPARWAPHHSDQLRDKRGRYSGDRSTVAPGELTIPPDPDDSADS